MHRYTGIHVYMYICIYEQRQPAATGIQVHRIQVYRYTGIQVHRYTGIQVYVCASIQLHWYAGFRTALSV